MWGTFVTVRSGEQTGISLFDSTKSWDRNTRSAAALCDQRVERVPQLYMLISFPSFW